MKIGNVSQTVLKRSVLKQLKGNREEVFMGPSVEETCSGLRLQEHEVLLESSVALYGDEKDLGVYAVARVTNNLCARQGNVVGVDVTIQLPPHAYESRLKTMVEYIEEECQRQKIQVMSMKVSVNPMVKSAIVFMTGFAYVFECDVKQTCMAQPDQDIVLINTIGTEGALRILNHEREELSERFNPSFLYKLEQQKEHLVIGEVLHMASQHGFSAIHPLGEGGILAGLWELGEAARLGMELDIKKMSILQETIEVCEFVGVNPYQLASGGCALVVTPNGEEMVRILRQKGLTVDLIGRTTTSRERVIINGEEKRFLDRPAPDELYKIFIENEN